MEGGGGGGDFSCSQTWQQMMLQFASGAQDSQLLSQGTDYDIKSLGSGSDVFPSGLPPSDELDNEMKSLGMHLPCNEDETAAAIPHVINEPTPPMNVGVGNAGSIQAGPSSAAADLPIMSPKKDTFSAPTKRKYFPERGEISTDDWPGPFNFNLDSPTECESRRKWAYSTDSTKVFCRRGVSVPFHLKMDFGGIENTKNVRMIRVMLVFEDDCMKTKAVVKCEMCMRDEQRQDKNEKRLHHIIRPSTEAPGLRYCKDKASEHCYLIIPAKIPEPGSNHMVLNLKFSCSNSHFLNTQRQQSGPDSPYLTAKVTSGIRIVFTLVDKCSGKVIGRASRKLCVASYPSRDWEIYEGNQNQKRKLIRDDSEGQKSKKLAKQDRKDLCNATTTGKQAKQRPEPTLSLLLPKEDEELVSSQGSISSSQEDVTGMIPLKRLVKNLRFSLHQLKSKEENVRASANRAYIAAQLLDELCRECRELGEAVANKKEKGSGALTQEKK